jgi:PAS domain S-box-containing protein
MKDFYRNHKFIIWFFIFGVFTLIIGIVNINSLREANEDTTTMLSTVTNDLALIGELQYQTQEVRKNSLPYLSTDDSKLRTQIANDSRQSDETVRKYIAQYSKSILSNFKNSELPDKLNADWNTYIASRDQTMELVQKQKISDAIALDQTVVVSNFNRVHVDLDKIKELYQQHALSQISANKAASRTSYIRMIGLRFLTLLAVGWAMYIVQRRMLNDVKQKAIQAEEARAFSDAIISSAGEGVIVLDRDLKFLVWNETMEHFSGIPANKMVGKQAISVFPWMISEGLDQQFEMALKGQRVSSSDISTEFSDGSIKWHSGVYSPHRNSKGEIIGIIGMISDVTQRKQDEEELRTATIQLEQSNRELQDFAFVASHDLQEPLRKIQAFGDRLKTKYGPTMDETAHDYLGRMQNAAARMQTLIHDLLTFSRVTSKSKPFESVDLEEITRAVLSDLEIRIEQTGATVDIAPLPIIDADPTQMRQLIQNLLSNALKFQKTDVKPHVRITADRVNSHGDFCEITVSDNGIGFDKKYADRIFTLFQRLHGRSEYEGTGVGLAVCRRIVERHGGKIIAESVPLEGAKFIISIPTRQSLIT